MVSLKEYIERAVNEKFALGAMNFNNMESLQGIVEACKDERSPAIISVSEGALAYMGDEYTLALAAAAKKVHPQLFLHLDHGKSLEICKKAINMGFDSVMIDGSALPFEENIKLTAEVCKAAHNKGVLVEGELGQIKGIEDNVEAAEHHYTDPEKAKIFVERTNVDMLAVAIGTSHGAYKYSGEKTLRFDILEKIEALLPKTPLVLHGASNVCDELVADFNRYGGELIEASGIPEELLKKAVREHNVVKINTDTDIRLAMTAETRRVLSENKNEFDLRKFLGAGRERVRSIISEKIRNIFYSNNKI